MKDKYQSAFIMILLGAKVSLRPPKCNLSIIRRGSGGSKTTCRMECCGFLKVETMVKVKDNLFLSDKP